MPNTLKNSHSRNGCALGWFLMKYKLFRILINLHLFVFFREMLDEIGELTLNTAWKKVRSLIKDDPRYDKFSSSDRVNICFAFKIHSFL